jgi:Bacterial regulatory proteins, gntR family
VTRRNLGQLERRQPRRATTQCPAPAANDTATAPALGCIARSSGRRARRHKGASTPGSTPVYQRIIDDIEAKIRAGELRPLDRLPSLAELTRVYGCSAQPVKTALRLLQ